MCCCLAGGYAEQDLLQAYTLPSGRGQAARCISMGKCAPITRLKLNRYLVCSEFISPVYWRQQIGLQTCLKLIPASYMMHHQASAMACCCKQPSLNAVTVAKPLPAASSWLGLEHLSGERMSGTDLLRFCHSIKPCCMHILQCLWMGIVQMRSLVC